MNEAGRPQELEQPEEEKQRMLFFRSGGEHFAVDITSVEEIIIGGEWTPVPLAPPSVVGVVNHRGKIFTVVNFARLAGLQEESLEEGKAIFLHRPDMSVGIAVTDIDGIEWVPCSLMGGMGKTDAGEQLACAEGLLDFEGRVATLIDSEQLADTIARLAEAGATAAVAGE